MSSTFVTIDPSKTDRKKLFGDTKPQKVWLQFVPGSVIDVATSVDSAAYTKPRDINSIIARSHISDDLNYKSTATTRYYPLMRGVVDTPVKGDQVLLCTFGGVNYYIGPINTINNPNWNIDHLNISDLDLSGGRKNKTSERDKSNLSKNFSIIPQARIQKLYNTDLDGPQRAIDDIHGDYVIEGRHGNSIRIGSRNVNPYIIISNGRTPENIVESINDGTIIGLFDNGTIRSHFKNDKIIENDEIVDYQFQLSSDSIEKPTRLVGGEDYNYEYVDSQLLHNSNKITLNSRKDNITLSSFRNTLIGAGGEIKLISNKPTTIESSNIYLGKQAQEEKEPLVLGTQLKVILEEIVGLFESLKVTACIAGLSGPVDPVTLNSVISIKNKLSNPKFLSEYHFIEDNGQKAD